MLNNCVCGLSCFHICSTNFFTRLWLRSVTPEVNISPGCYQLVKRSKQCFLPPSQVYYLSSLIPSCLCATGLWSSTLEWSITADHWSRNGKLGLHVLWFTLRTRTVLIKVPGLLIISPKEKRPMLWTQRLLDQVFSQGRAWQRAPSREKLSFKVANAASFTQC